MTTLLGYGIVSLWFGALVYVAGSHALGLAERAILGALGG